MSEMSQGDGVSVINLNDGVNILQVDKGGGAFLAEDVQKQLDHIELLLAALITGDIPRDIKAWCILRLLRTSSQNLTEPLL